MLVKYADQDSRLPCATNYMKVNAIPVRLNFGMPLAAIYMSAKFNIALAH